jgi:hypothetical protein
VVLDVPSSVAVLAQADTVMVITWQYAGTDVSGFEVERQIGTGNRAATGNAGAAVLQYADRYAFAIGEKYSYRVCAMSGAKRSAYVQSAAMNIRLGYPSNVSATRAGDTSVVVRWTFAGSFQTGFELERQAGSGSWIPLGSVGADERQYTDTHMLKVGETYWYRVRALSKNNMSIFLASLPFVFDPWQNMVYVEGGTFFMGLSTGYSAERPAHGVTLSPFYLDKMVRFRAR